MPEGTFPHAGIDRGHDTAGMRPWNLTGGPTTPARHGATDPPRDTDPHKDIDPTKDGGVADAGFGTGAAGLRYGGPADDIRYADEPDQAFGTGSPEQAVPAVPQGESEPAVLADGSLVLPGGLVITHLPPPDTSDDTADALPWVWRAEDEGDEAGQAEADVTVRPEPDGT